MPTSAPTADLHPLPPKLCSGRTADGQTLSLERDRFTGIGYLLPEQPVESAEQFLSAGGGTGLIRAMRLGAQATLDELKASGLRGRGGAGFPTGAKWESIRAGGTGQRFVVVNGAEGEPATFKDRMLMRSDPYRIVEGAAIAAFVVGAGTIYLATKRSYRREVEALTRAARRAQRRRACCRS